MLFKTVCDKLSIFMQPARQKIKSDQKHAHINPITVFSVHVNTTFGFINQNEFIPIEAKSVHVSIAIDSFKDQSFI